MWAAHHQEAAWILLALALFVLVASHLQGPPTARRAGMVACVAATGAGIAWALHLGWVADDAFISFRYARNWVDGLGLVFNAGERVEGYTNFLWIVLLSPFQALGLSLPPVAVALNLGCFALTIIATASFAKELGARLAGSPGSPLPIAACFLALNYTFASFGTSGLETMLGALLVLLAAQRAERGEPLASGALAIAATLTHPDHAIFYAGLACTFALERRFRALARFALPFFVIYVPYFAWRWSYYGDFFPNTYYAKNAGQFYFSQGARYLLLSGLSGGLWAALPLAVYAMLRLRRLRLARFCALAVPAFLLYVGKIGGDFMLGRLLCPLLPPVFILAELGLRELARRAGGALRRETGAALALFCTSVVPVRVVKRAELRANIADERTFYPIRSYLPFSLASAYWDWAHAFNRTFEHLSRPPKLAMYSVGIVSYETELPMVDNAGLNHRAVAHWRIRYRGRPGHEKIISPGLLVQSGADLSDVAVYPEPYRALGRVDVDGVRFHAVKYDARLFSELALAGVSPPPLLDYVRSYTPPSDPARLECDLWHLRQIYFRHDPASPLRRPLLLELAEAYPGEALAQQFALTKAPPDAAAWRRVASLDFERLDPRSERTGDAFHHNPMSREAVGQPPLAGTRGRFIDTFQDDNGDMATGELRSAPFEIQGDFITLNIGGGFYPEGTYAELLVGGQRRFRATGCNSGILGRRVWDTRAWVGELAVLHIVDRLRRPFGHIVVDDLVQWASADPARATLSAAPAGADGVGAH